MIVLWCAIPLSPQSVDSDFWGHVQYGQDTWNFGLSPVATYTYTAVGHPWINHENLSELIMALGAQGLGPSSLLALKCVLGCLVLGLAINASGREQPAIHPIIMGSICVIVALNLSFYWGLRPHVFTFALFGILVALVEWCFQGWAGHWNLPWPRVRHADKSRRIQTGRLHYLWFAPVLLAVWANTHGGFLAGVAVYVGLLLCRAVEIIAVQGRSSWKTAAYLILLAAAGAMATLLNPYGFELHRWLIESLSVPRPEILEWHPPDWFHASSVKLWLMLGLAAGSFIASKQPRDLTRIILFTLVTFEALKHQRHIPFVAILVLFWIPRHVQSVVSQLRLNVNATHGAAWNRVAKPVSACLILMCGLFSYRVGTRLIGVPVSNQEYPVDAIQFMADESLTGRLVVTGHWAQYALGVLGARTQHDEGLTVAFDGRFRTCYPQEIVDMYFDFFVGDGGPDERYRSPQSPPADPKRILNHLDPDLVLVSRHEAHPVSILQREQNGWVMLYQDQLAQLWGRRSMYGQKSHDRYFPPHRRQLTLTVPKDVIPWPAAPHRNVGSVSATIDVNSTTNTRHPK